LLYDYKHSSILKECSDKSKHLFILADYFYKIMFDLLIKLAYSQIKY